jgi:predicted ATP-grasp superfamily ATP-dependent carboligase
VATSNAPTRVLVAVDESTGSVAAVRALRAGGYEPWAAFHQSPTYTVRSRTLGGKLRVPWPEDDEDAYATAVASAAWRSKAAVVLPASENALRALTGREDRFPAGVVVGVSSRETLERATDKEALAEHAAAVGLATPPSVALGRGDDLAPALAMGFPAIVKPARSVTPEAGGSLRVTDVERVEDATALAAAVASFPGDRVVVQRHLAGALTAVTGVAWDGEVVCLSHQVAHRIWPPQAGVTSMGETVPADPDLDDRVRLLVARLGWSGIFGTQFIRSDGRDYLIDFNPRVYGSLALAVAAGANLPAIWVDLLLGRPPRPAESRPGTRYRVEEDDPRALLHAFRAGRRREALRGLLPHRRTVHAVFSLRDPLPFSVSAVKILGRPQRSARQTSRAISAQSSSRGRAASSTRTSSLRDSSR